MNRIKILTPEISNKIAAGEVVERPASVIKELVENAVDAGASSITVEVKNGGISFIRITDNGCGMEREDAKTAFLRHATSKIFDEEDLEKIKTLGFRGEALASIAAVSNIEIMTKTKNADGFFIELTAGKITDEHEVGCPDGTTIIVKNLFYNTPARMKFLKKDKTEAGYIKDIVERLILSNKNISIKYIEDGKRLILVDKNEDLKARVYNIYGRDYAASTVEVDRNENNICVTGLAGKASISRGNRAFQSLFVNGRYVKSKSITYAVESAYKNALMIGKFPFFVIDIQLAYDLVDINVHPTKQEVKFADEKAVCSEVYWAVKNAISESADEVRNEIKSFAEPFNKPAFFESKPNVQMSFNKASAVENRMSEPSVIPFLMPTVPEAESEPQYKIIGQLFDTYIIIEVSDKIILIDQHAAHERMIYERLLEQRKQKNSSSQVLLSPVAITLSATEYSNLLQKMDFFKQLGFELEEFGSNTILVRQTPADVFEDGLKELLLELLDDLKYGDLTTREGEILHMVACKAAVKANKYLQKSEIHCLINELLKTGGINTCPHGRPIMTVITKYELEKMFKRV